ncbi:hypothetical protein [Clostridium sp. DL1XJH146]
MVYVFHGKKGIGKTKNMIKLANEKILDSKGNIVYIDDDNKPIFDLDTRIRFVATRDFNLKNYKNFYGFLCGILSEDYDIETVFIDGLFNMVNGKEEDAAHLFYDMEKLAHNYGLDLYININIEDKEIPEYIRKYSA